MSIGAVNWQGIKTKKTVKKTGKASSKTKTSKAHAGQTVTYKVVSVIPLGPYMKEKASQVKVGLSKDKSVKVSPIKKVKGGYGVDVTAVSYQKYPYGVTPEQVKAHMRQNHPDVKCTVTRDSRR
jgi:hypothetical protein